MQFELGGDCLWQGGNYPKVDIASKTDSHWNLEKLSHVFIGRNCLIVLWTELS